MYLYSYHRTTPVPGSLLTQVFWDLLSLVPKTNKAACNEAAGRAINSPIYLHIFVFSQFTMIQHYLKSEIVTTCIVQKWSNKCLCTFMIIKGHLFCTTRRLFIRVLSS